MPKKTGCTICNCTHADAVKNMLDSSMPYPVIVEFLKTKGIEISTMTVSRHKNNCLEGKKKPKQLQKGKAKAAQSKAKKKVKKASKKDKDKRLQDTFDAIDSASNDNLPIDERRRRLRVFREKMDELEEDCDVIGELRDLLLMHKSRVLMAMAEEEESGLILGTTSSAMKEYKDALKLYKDATEGMDSLQQLRYAQLNQMIGQVFCSAKISDRTRFELNVILKDISLPEEKLEAPTISVDPNDELEDI